VVPEPYAFQPDHIKHQVIDRVTRGLMGLAGDLWIFLLSKQWSAGEIMREMGRRSANPVWQEHQREVREYLRYYLPFHRVNLIVVPPVTLLTLPRLKPWDSREQRPDSRFLTERSPCVPRFSRLRKPTNAILPSGCSVRR